MAKKTWAERSTGQKALIIGAWGLIGLFVYGQVMRDDGSQDASEAAAVAAAGPVACGDQELAWRAPMRAKDYVRDALISPSSAKFQNDETYLMPSNDAFCIYTVTGAVDAANRFGVMIRHDYAAKVQYSRTDDAWSPVEVAVAEP
ncbi:hypothetical protein [Paracoccus hibiscisoli]|uniref:Uncharacterized protein n=1 Tax=Paracoccus hibiscisoli TaxID=2023261 RepID=A0A4U0QVW0_9RHOB|nr:hypothetical protein [Paracoccus hibiscisoli]TJZ86176.1 hypothetical protein FA740_04620 [Paracoccus hibiscisoli]